MPLPLLGAARGKRKIVDIKISVTFQSGEKIQTHKQTGTAAEGQDKSK